MHIVQRRPAQGARTAGRAVALLEIVASSDSPLSVAEVARGGQTNRSAAYRALRQLEEQAFLAKEPNHGGYVVGPRFLALSALVLRKLPVRTLARPVMERLVALSGETVSLHLRNLDRRICIDVVEGTHPVRRVVPVGESLPLHAGPSGKVIVAFLSFVEQTRILEAAAAEGQEVARIEGQIRLIRRQGYLSVVGDRLPGVAAVSVPLFDSTGVIGSLSISGPERWAPSMARIVPEVLADSRELSHRLGHQPTVGGPTTRDVHGWE